MFPFASALLLILVLRLALFVVEVAYRLSPFHPLYSFPGPLLAKATFLYEIYFDLIKGGLYTQEIQRLHTVYGPLVRINPDGLHSNDPYFVDEVYAGGNRKRNKPFLHVRFLVGACVYFDPIWTPASLSPQLFFPRFKGKQPNNVRGVTACGVLEDEDLLRSGSREDLVGQLLGEAVDVTFDLGYGDLGEELVQGLATESVYEVVLSSEG